ncbi:hypothetical protein GX51_01077 [Blastomyces parvus]|uniref:Uncharacterized protein n=1 Tax=Blastomyces parvus TaxID=2060905 RepID=A0A2B7XIV9_9EURO|nr:hypothetical protein GX51_01077 [Blastomyces parvus]
MAAPSMTSAPQTSVVFPQNPVVCPKIPGVKQKHGLLVPNDSSWRSCPRSTSLSWWWVIPELLSANVWIRFFRWLNYISNRDRGDDDDYTTLSKEAGEHISSILSELNQRGTQTIWLLEVEIEKSMVVGTEFSR